MSTRRQFLALMAAAAMPLPQLPRFAQRGSPQRIVVLAKAEGRIHFAGEHTSPWTGWMQGALESARRVVSEITGG